MGAIGSLTLINILLKLSISLDDGNEEGDVLFHKVLETKDGTGRTVFLQAVYSGAVDIVKILAERGSDIDVKDNNGNGAMKIAKETLPEVLRKPMVKQLKVLLLLLVV